MSAPRRRKKYPPLRLVERPRLLEPVGFRQYAFEQFAHWKERRTIGPAAFDMQLFFLSLLYLDWHRDRRTDAQHYDEPDFDAMADEIVMTNNTREAVVVCCPRLAASNGVRVQG